MTASDVRPIIAVTLSVKTQKGSSGSENPFVACDIEGAQKHQSGQNCERNFQVSAGIQFGDGVAV